MSEIFRKDNSTLRNPLYLIALVTLAAVPCFASATGTCSAGTPVDKFRFVLEPKRGGPALPVNSVNAIRPGEKLKYEPFPPDHKAKSRAKVAVILVPASPAKSRDITLLKPQPADAPAQWHVPLRASIVGLVYGPHGLDVKKVHKLVKHNQELIPQLADYAQHAATVEALVRTLTQYEQSPPASRDLEAVLRGFSSQYGVTLPQLSSGAPADQQAATLLHAVVPALSSYDPLAQQGNTSSLQQSAGLAAWVAALFLGSTPVGLAAGGASLFQNMRTLMFPGTDFRAAFCQETKSKAMELCAAPQKAAPRTRLAYLWAVRIPDVGPPSASLSETEHLPLDAKSTVRITCTTHAQLRNLPRARDWKLISPSRQAAVPVTVAFGSSVDTATIDLRKIKIAAGEYHLAALWDWTPFDVAGTLKLHPFGNLTRAKITPESADRLVEGSGLVKVELTGADFEFVTKMAIVKASRHDATAKNLLFTLPARNPSGEQRSIQTKVDTTSLGPGAYLLMLTQSNGAIQDVPITIHPPNPKIDNLPLRANLGETHQTLTLRGSGLERIESIRGAGTMWELAKSPENSKREERKAILKLSPHAHKGELIDASISVQGIGKPLVIPDVIKVVGPRPRILSAKASVPAETGVARKEGEIPSNSAVSFSIQGKNLGSRPSLGLTCANTDDTRQALSLDPGERDGSAELDLVGNDDLFLSLNPGIVGESGCVLTATVTDTATGTSDPYTLGRVIRLPRIIRFALTGEKLGNSCYLGFLTGEDLQVVEKTGWNASTGIPVRGIPTPVPGRSREQTLKIEMPWPPPAPHAPVFIWLRGEERGRVTTARY